MNVFYSGYKNSKVWQCVRERGGDREKVQKLLSLDRHNCSNDTKT